MDNLNIHHNQECIASLEKNGITPVFMPAYLAKYLSPLDNKFFGTLKTAYAALLSDTTNKLSKEDLIAKVIAQHNNHEELSGHFKNVGITKEIINQRFLPQINFNILKPTNEKGNLNFDMMKEISQQSEQIHQAMIEEGVLTDDEDDEMKREPVPEKTHLSSSPYNDQNLTEKAAKCEEEDLKIKKLSDEMRKKTEEFSRALEEKNSISKKIKELHEQEAGKTENKEKPNLDDLKQQLLDVETTISNLEHEISLLEQQFFPSSFKKGIEPNATVSNSQMFALSTADAPSPIPPKTAKITPSESSNSTEQNTNSSDQSLNESVLQDVIIDLTSDDEIDKKIGKINRFLEAKHLNQAIQDSLGQLDPDVELIEDPLDDIHPPVAFENKKGTLLSEMPEIIEGEFVSRDIDWAHLSCLSRCQIVLKEDLMDKPIEFGVINSGNSAAKILWKWYEEKKKEQMSKKGSTSMRVDIGYSGLHFSTLITILYRSTLICFHYDPLDMHHPETGLWDIPFKINKMPSKRQNDSNSCGYLALGMAMAISKYIHHNPIPPSDEIVDWCLQLASERNNEEFDGIMSFYLTGAIMQARYEQLTNSQKNSCWKRIHEHITDDILTLLAEEERDNTEIYCNLQPGTYLDRIRQKQPHFENNYWVVPGCEKVECLRIAKMMFSEHKAKVKHEETPVPILMFSQLSEMSPEEKTRRDLQGFLTPFKAYQQSIEKSKQKESPLPTLQSSPPSDPISSKTKARRPRKRENQTRKTRNQKN